MDQFHFYGLDRLAEMEDYIEEQWGSTMSAADAVDTIRWWKSQFKKELGRDELYEMAMEGDDWTSTEIQKLLSDWLELTKREVEKLRGYVLFPEHHLERHVQYFPPEHNCDPLLRVFQGRHQDINLRHHPQPLK